MRPRLNPCPCEVWSRCRISRASTLEVLGIDIFTNAPFLTFDPINFDAGKFDVQRWLGDPGAIAVTEEFVAKHDLKPCIVSAESLTGAKPNQKGVFTLILYSQKNFLNFCGVFLGGGRKVTLKPAVGDSEPANSVMNLAKIVQSRMLLTMVLIGLLAMGVLWWLVSQRQSIARDAPNADKKKVLYYQSAMHPWVKSDKPGKCTVCGMELVPVYDTGQAGSGAATDIVMLPEGAPNVASIKTVEVRRQPLARTLRVAGMIQDDDSKHRILSAYTGGRIEKLFVNFVGAEVKAGQPIATFYSKDLVAAIREYKVAYGQGSSPLLTASQMRLQQLGLSQDQIAKAHQRSETDIFVDILAPVTGTVVKRYVYEGQYVQEGEKLFEVADFSTMWFQFIAYEQDLPSPEARPERDGAHRLSPRQSLSRANQVHRSEH